MYYWPNFSPPPLGWSSEILFPKMSISNLVQSFEGKNLTWLIKRLAEQIVKDGSDRGFKLTEKEVLKHVTAFFLEDAGVDSFGVEDVSDEFQRYIAHYTFNTIDCDPVNLCPESKSLDDTTRNVVSWDCSGPSILSDNKHVGMR